MHKGLVEDTEKRKDKETLIKVGQRDRKQGKELRILERSHIGNISEHIFLKIRVGTQRGNIYLRWSGENTESDTERHAMTKSEYMQWSRQRRYTCGVVRPMNI